MKDLSCSSSEFGRNPHSFHCSTMRWTAVLFTIILCGTAAKLDLSSICIGNCGQCKRMLGPFFKGPACASMCIRTNGIFSPDCNNPHTVKAYLRRPLMKIPNDQGPFFTF